MQSVIQTSQLSKHYSNVKAVDDLNIDIKKGELYGFLGLNGAGKTTTIRMMLGMIKPTGGDIFLFGEKISHSTRKLWNKVGHLVEIPYSYPELTVNENLEIFSRIRKLKMQSHKKDIIESLYLEQYLNVKAKNLSLGNAQRLGIAKAMIHKPLLLFLDEPANGLDPEGIVQIREMLQDLAENHGVTIFISSHILGEISILAKRIGIIHKGRLIREADSEHIDKERKRSLIINTLDNNKALDLLKIRGLAPKLNTLEEIVVYDKNTLDKPEIISELLVKNDVMLKKLVVNEEDLEHYFLRIIHSNTNIS